MAAVAHPDGTPLPWNEAWGLVSEILRRSSSHLRSSLAGDLYVPEGPEIATWDTFEGWLNTQTKKGAAYKRIKRPWAGKPSTAPTVAHDPEREARREQIRKMTGRPART
ncbi:MAG: hypothetical protein AB7G37_20005 [Solirubrobacteraceae bacterium]